MFSLSNLKTLRSLLRFLLALRSLVRSLTFLAAFFHLRFSLAATLSSLSYSHLLLPVFAFPWAQSTSGSALSLLSALLLLFFGGGELWRYWPSGLWSRMSRHTSGGSITLTPVCTFCFLSLSSPFSCFLLWSCFLWALPLLLGLLGLWIQCVLCFLSYLFGIKNNVLIFVLWIVPRLAWRECFWMADLYLGICEIISCPCLFSGFFIPIWITALVGNCSIVSFY